MSLLPAARACAGNLREALIEMDMKIGMFVPGEWKINQRTERGVTTQRHIDLPKPNDVADVAGRMRALAGSVAMADPDADAVTFYQLWVPPEGRGVVDCALATIDGVSVRLLQVYDASIDEIITRVDALFEPHELGATA